MKNNFMLQKKNHRFLLAVVFSSILLSSCKKNSIGGSPDSPVTNRPPIANAGIDRTITLPENSVLLNGSGSTDPVNNIASYSWTKISGPSSFNINTANGVQTHVINLVIGTYEFELEVTDTKGLSDKDTIQVEVKPYQQSFCNVFFYFPDPTATITSYSMSFDSPVPTLITITINNSSGVLSGFFRHDYTPKCPISSDYNSADTGTYVELNMPPGTYYWEARSSVINMTSYPEITPPLISYFLAPHSTSGTITILPGDQCKLQKIVF